MAKASYFILTFIFFFVSLVQSQSDKTFESFGEEITVDGSISYNDMLDQLKGSDTLETKVRAQVNAVCQMAGCWMNVSDTEMAAAESTFVRFKDYGFFVPKDISGKEVIMEGIAYRSVTSVDELKHFAEDEGKSAEEIAKITEPKEELVFMASGVLVEK